MRTLFLLTILLIAGNYGFSQSEPVLLKTGDSLISLKKWEAAIQVYSKVLKQNPRSEKALLNRGYAYLNTEKLAAAEKDYTEAIKFNPKCITCIVQTGIIKLLKNDNPAALSFANQALKLDSNSSGAYALKGRIAKSHANYKEAAEYLDKAVAIDGSNAEALYHRAMNFFGLNQPDRAMNDLTAINKLMPDFAPAYYEKGIWLANQQKLDEALQNFLLALQKDSANAEYHKVVGQVYLYKQEPATALKYYSNAIKLNNKDYISYFYRAGAYHTLEDMEASCSDYKAALATIPAKDTAEYTKELKDDIIASLAEFCDSSTASYYYQRGVASYNLKQFEKAIEWYNKGLTRFPRHFMLLSFRGNAGLLAGKYKEAESDYTQSLALKNQLAYETAQSMNFRAATEAERASYVIGSIIEVYSRRGEVRLNLGNYAGAFADLEEALKLLAPNSPQRALVYGLMGAVYLAQEDNNNALTWLNRAVQADPGYIQALVNLAIVKLNLAYKTTVAKRTAYVNNSTINLPQTTSTSVNTGTLESALSDCNKAIAIDKNFAYAYYVRAIIKLSLSQPDYCYDLMKAEQLGYNESKTLIDEKKCR
jgi:tetratricopeptide (TPR) repeat protein